MERRVPVGIYIFKVNNRNTRTRCQICSKLTIKTPERRRFGVFIVDFEHLTPCSSVYIVNFEKVNAGWGISYLGPKIIPEEFKKLNILNRFKE